VFYRGGVAAAMTRKWSLSTAPWMDLWDGIHSVCNCSEFFKKIELLWRHVSRKT